MESTVSIVSTGGFCFMDGMDSSDGVDRKN
jgi:hypothetical protein